MSEIIYTLPIETVSEANTRCHWRLKHKRAANQRKDAAWGSMLPLAGFYLLEEGDINITLVRLSNRKLDDDNLCSALKAVRDGIADAFKMNDGINSRLKWIYKQESGHEQKAVRVEIRC